jgi:Flp pilus assembly pilin Flp
LIVVGAVEARLWIGLVGRRIGVGQGLVEYGLILGLSALLTIVILAFFGGAVSDALQLVGNAIDRSTGR